MGLPDVATGLLSLTRATAPQRKLFDMSLNVCLSPAAQRQTRQAPFVLPFVRAPVAFCSSSYTFVSNEVSPSSNSSVTRGAVSSTLRSQPSTSVVLSPAPLLGGHPTEEPRGGCRGGRRKCEDRGVPMEDLVGANQFRGHVFSIAKDQAGCRLLQKKLEDGESVRVISREVLEHLVELMVDPFGNYLCQKLMEVSTGEALGKLIEMCRPNLVTISLNMHGTRAVQKLIEVVSLPEQVARVVSALEDSVVCLVKDLNGNHVIQKCLNCLSASQCDFIYRAIVGHCVEVATHRHGCCVLQRCVDAANKEQKALTIKEIAAHSLTLVQDAFGNYVVQYILNLNEPEITNTVIQRLSGHTAELSKQKFSSNVIEKCLTLANTEGRRVIIYELLDGGRHLLKELLVDSFANYVVQRALNVSEEPEFTALLDTIWPHLDDLRCTAPGKKIAAKLTKKYPRLLHSPPMLGHYIVSQPGYIGYHSATSPSHFPLYPLGGVDGPRHPPPPPPYNQRRPPLPSCGSSRFETTLRRVPSKQASFKEHWGGRECSLSTSSSFSDGKGFRQGLAEQSLRSPKMGPCDEGERTLVLGGDGRVCMQESGQDDGLGFPINPLANGKDKKRRTSDGKSPEIKFFPQDITPFMGSLSSESFAFAESPSTSATDSYSRMSSGVYTHFSPAPSLATSSSFFPDFLPVVSRPPSSISPTSTLSPVSQPGALSPTKDGETDAFNLRNGTRNSSSLFSAEKNVDIITDGEMSTAYFGSSSPESLDEPTATSEWMMHRMVDMIQGEEDDEDKACVERCIDAPKNFVGSSERLARCQQTIGEQTAGYKGFLETTRVSMSAGHSSVVPSAFLGPFPSAGGMSYTWDPFLGGGSVFRSTNATESLWSPQAGSHSS